MIAAPIAIWAYVHRDDGVRIAPGNFAEVNARGVPFSVPEGYVAELVARSPLVLNPMYASFDDRGGLYVAGFSDQGGTDHPDVIRRLEDVDGDGRFDRSTLFASGLSYPE